MKFNLVYKTNESGGILAASILILLENGVTKVVSDNQTEETVMSILYAFSRERIAEALASLCNNEIISIDYRTKKIYYTPVFYHLLHLSEGIVFNGESTDKIDCVYEIFEKIEILKSVDPNTNFGVQLKSFDLQVV